MKTKPTHSSRIHSVSHDAPVDDLVQAIQDDHADLKKFISVMKDDEAKTSEKKEAAFAFMGLLKSHAPSEEKALYAKCQKVKDLRLMADEGFVEHGIADRLMKAIQNTRNPDRWLAQVKVLAELVEHHIEEEESELLPAVQKHFKASKQEEMAHEFFALRKRSQPRHTDANAGVLRV